MKTGADADTDDGLVRRIAAADESAMAELYRRHSAWLYARLRRRVGSEEIAADALQDTFLAVWTGARSWRGDGDVGAWIWGIGLRRLVSRLRSRAAPVPLGDARILADSSVVSSAEEAVLLGVEHGDLGAALGRLAPELRTVVQAVLIDGLTSAEAAILLGLPEGTVKSRIRRAKELLRLAMAAGSGQVGRYS